MTDVVENGKKSTSNLSGDRSRSSSLDSSPPVQSFTKRVQSSISKPSQPSSRRFRIEEDEDDFVPLPPPKSSKTQTQNTRSGGTQVTFNDGRNTQLSLVPESQALNRKRSIVDLEDEIEDGIDELDELLPGAAMMKKRRVEQEEAGERSDPEITKTRSSTRQEKTEKFDLVENEKEEPVVTGKKKRKEMDPVIKTAQAIRQREEEEAALQKAQHEATREMHGSIEKFKNMGIVESFEVLPRTNKPLPRSAAYGDEGSRWDERWNGRKNFKKFKKRVADPESEMRRIAGPLVVDLVEHKVKDYGLGDGKDLHCSINLFFNIFY